MKYSKQNTPRWLIFSIDVVISLISVLLAFLVRFDFSHIPEQYSSKLHLLVGFVLLVRILVFIITKSYAGIVRYTSTYDTVRIVLITLAGSLLLVIANAINFYFLSHVFIIPFSIIVIDFFISTFTMISFRIIVKMAYIEMNNPKREKQNVIIFGAGESGIITKRSLDRDAGTKYKVIAFIDDDLKKIGKTLDGIKIYPFSQLDELLNDAQGVKQVILSIQKITIARKKEIIEMCLQKNVRVLTVPPVHKWINGELSFKQIKRINIEDLLERDVIQIDEDIIKDDLLDKVVMITGAAGSIGSEIVRRIAPFHPQLMILVDQAETPMFHLEMELKETVRNVNYKIIIADIRNKVRMQTLFDNYRPSIVYHAAAYKHVPMMENNPLEAALTNIIGTKHIADLAVEYNASKFVFISTDKAVRPTNVMGATKRIAEMYTQSLNQLHKTRFITTRFGNVLGSNGSVVELFRKQLAAGGPLTITHPEVTRFFMTIPEACRLVLEAGAMGKGGEIFIFDMGRSVKIVDLAKKIILLSGLTLGKDIQIVFTGLRPGEKLYEELLNDQENTLPTHHPQILIARIQEHNLNEVIKHVESINAHATSYNTEELIKYMKLIVPDFISNNSIFEKFDHPVK